MNCVRQTHKGELIVWTGEPHDGCWFIECEILLPDGMPLVNPGDRHLRYERCTVISDGDGLITIHETDEK